MTLANGFVFRTFSLLIFCLSVASSARAAEPCHVGNGGEAALLQCYEREFDEKFRDNESKHRDLLIRARQLFKRGATYTELAAKYGRTVTEARKIAKQSCARFANKFQSHDTSIVATVNCRTEHEVTLEKQLRQFANELKDTANL